MDEIITKILEVESESAGMIEAHKIDHDVVVSRQMIAAENKKNQRKKQIIGENGERYKKEVGMAEREIAGELSGLQHMLNGLKDNPVLCEEVRKKVISQIFQT